MQGPSFYSTKKYRALRDAATNATSGISTNEIYDAVIQRVKTLAKRGKALDVGAGIGILCHRLIETDQFEWVVGVDFLSPHENLKGVPWVRCDLNFALPFMEGAFDLVTCIEVLEHMENPWDLARKLRSMVKEGGALLLTTPNNESLRSYLSYFLRGYYPSFPPSCYPTHLTPFLRVDLIRLLKAAGFSDVVIRYTNQGVIPKMKKLHWQNLDGSVLFKGQLFSDNYLVEARA